MYRYSVKLVDRAFLWGASGINEKPGVPLLLTVAVDPVGDPIDISWLLPGVAAPVPKAIGRLMPGQVFTLNLQEAAAVVAQPVHGGSCRVDCVLSVRLKEV